MYGGGVEGWGACDDRRMLVVSERGAGMAQRVASMLLRGADTGVFVVVVFVVVVSGVGESRHALGVPCDRAHWDVLELATLGLCVSDFQNSCP